jgi:hypothetical protein
MCSVVCGDFLFFFVPKDNAAGIAKAGGRK